MTPQTNPDQNAGLRLGPSAGKGQSCGPCATIGSVNRDWPAQGTGLPDLTLTVGLATDAGSVRELNEDYVHCFVPVPADEAQKRRGAIFLVADGMGGHQAGEVASRWAAERVAHEYYADPDSDPGDSLVRALKLANQMLYDQAQADPAKAGMGTTMVAAVVLGRRVYVVNVGDSRAYFINRQEISRITEDHSWVEEQVQAGFLTREQAERHPQRNLITRALGTKPSVEVDLFKGEIQEGDILLLCSDGLSGSLLEQQMAAIARAESPPQAAARLIAQAKEQKAEDNVSVLIVRAATPPDDRRSDRQPASKGRGAAVGQAGLPSAQAQGGLPEEVPTQASPVRPVHQGVRLRRPLVVVKAWLGNLAGRLAGPEKAPALRPEKAPALRPEKAPALRDHTAPVPWPQKLLARRVVVAILVLVCLLGAALTLIAGVSRDLAADPVAAPQLAPIHDEHLARRDVGWLAGYLGYSNPEQMLAASQGAGASAGQDQFDPAKPGSVEPGKVPTLRLWPAEHGVFVVGLARETKCQAQACTFRLDMAGTAYEVSLERQFLVKDDISLDKRRVRVFGYQQEETGPGRVVAARLIDQGARWWAWWQPAWVTVYRNQNWEAAVWVYSVLDRNPYSLVSMDRSPAPPGAGALPGLGGQRGDRILLRGKWLNGGPREPMSFAADSTYRLEADAYVPVAGQGTGTTSGQPNPEPQPTVTLRPTDKP